MLPLDKIIEAGRPYACNTGSTCLLSVPPRFGDGLAVDALDAALRSGSVLCTRVQLGWPAAQQNANSILPSSHRHRFSRPEPPNPFEDGPKEPSGNGQQGDPARAQSPAEGPRWQAAGWRKGIPRAPGTRTLPAWRTPHQLGRSDECRGRDRGQQRTPGPKASRRRCAHSTRLRRPLSCAEHQNS